MRKDLGIARTLTNAKRLPAEISASFIAKLNREYARAALQRSAGDNSGAHAAGARLVRRQDASHD
jgi:hypothetical protein